MPKNIIFCADGTCNGPGEVDDQLLPDPTNVYKLFVQLNSNVAPPGSAQDDELETIEPANGTALAQYAKYIDGVGDSDNPIIKLFGGAAGAGLVARVVRGYTYISRVYDPGDNIFLVGFSRGGYTVRALAGLILFSGLLDKVAYDLAAYPTNRVQAYQLGAGAWYHYQRTVSVNGGLLGDFDKLVLGFPGFFTEQPRSLVSVPNITAIGVWDTVSSYGFSAAYDDAGAKDDLFPLANARLSLSVNCGFQAISLDEQRDVFIPILWDEAPNVVQRLFPGAHADVGGGYSIAKGEAQLSDGALKWMISCLQTQGVLFFPNQRFAELSIPAGIAHQQWRYPPWTALSHSVRNFKALGKLEIDPSVTARGTAGVVTFDPGSNAGILTLPPITGIYRPANLP